MWGSLDVECDFTVLWVHSDQFLLTSSEFHFSLAQFLVCNTHKSSHDDDAQLGAEADGEDGPVPGGEAGEVGVR